MVVVVMAVIMIAGACGGADEEPELTDAERLALIEGRSLTESEVAELLEVGATLCQLDETVLDAMWRRLTDDQMAFQDFVFERICPDRSVFYAGLTGRYVTDAATESGVVTSTTRPEVTTTDVAPAETTTPDPLTDLPGGAVQDDVAVDGGTEDEDSPLSTTSTTSVPADVTGDG